MCRLPPTAAFTANGRIRSVPALSTSCRSSMSRSSPSSASSRRHPGMRDGRARSRAAPPRRPVLANTGPVPRRGEELRRVGGFAVGGRVFHQKFGYGTITAVEDNKLAIHFDVAGDKKIMDAFVEHA